MKFIKHIDIVDLIKRKYPNVIANENKIGTFNKEELDIKIKEGTEPKYIDPRTVPFALRKLIEKEINGLLKLGVVVPIDYSEWGTPIVPLLKDNNNVKISGAYDVTVNPHLVMEYYPLPKINDILASIRKGSKFSIIDLKYAYQQFKLNKASQKLTVNTTHLGDFMFLRLPYEFGIGPAKLQKKMEKLLASIGVFIFYDDILITADFEEEHLRKIEFVISTLESAGLCVNIDKCQFGVDKITYLGHTINQDGIRPSKKCIEAIIEQTRPTTRKQVESFLGMVNHYSKFISFRTEILAPLNEITKTDVKFVWSDECEEAFTRIKKRIGIRKIISLFQRKIGINFEL